MIGILLGLFGFGCALVSLATDRIQTRWPFTPIRREDQPQLYWFFVYAWMLIGGVGLLMAIASVARS